MVGVRRASRRELGSGAGRRTRVLAARHRHLRNYFGGSGVARERERYRRDVTGWYRQELIERFLAQHAGSRSGSCLEVGPGPGRFSRWLAARYRSLTVLDLSRPMLRACRQRLARARPGRDADFVEGSLEALPFREQTFDRIVALGVLLFVADEFPRVLAELGRRLTPGGKLLFEIQSPSQTTMTVLPPNPSGARTILHHPKEYHLWSVVRAEYQPHDPEHWAKFEVIWRRPERLRQELSAAGLRLGDLMAIGPNFGNQPTLLRALRRDPMAYATALRLEEETGRWPELLGAGAGTLVAATPGHR